MNYNWDWGVFFKSTGVGSETYLDWYIAGLGWTIAIAVVAWIIALLLGSILGVMRTVPNRLVSGIATCYVELFRNVPLLVQLFIWYFLVPDLLPQNLQDWYKQDLNPTTSAYLSVVVCLGLFTAARVCEQVRTGIQALPRGQEAAARHGLQAAADLLERAAAPGLPDHHSAAHLGIPQRVQELLRGVLDRPDGTAGANQADRRVLRQPV
jgi:glutamate/aspartate transport system permease protein